ncbi:MAG TPA: sugar porter family MFS transporter [Mycobacteriales bacterium]|nr:sugar porter family MFS transporter [Mycobacteriales bacterium]
MSGESATTTSGLAYIRFAFSGKHRFVTGIAALAAIGGFLFGYDTGIVSQALPYIAKDFKASAFEQSWIVASLLLGAVIGAIGSGYLSDRISRKWTKCLSGCVYVGGAIASALAQDVVWLCVARFVLGFAVGTASFVSPEYISEQTPPRVRGGTVTYNQIMITLGIFLAYLVGFGLRDVTDNWRWMLGIGGIPGAVLAISMVFVPHTPRWLVRKGRADEARAVLERTRQDADIDAELKDMKEVVEESSRYSIRDLFGRRLRSLMLMGIALAVFQQFVGINTVIYFATTILKYTGVSTNTSVALAVFVGLTNFVTTIVAALLMDWVGRRRLLLPGTVILTVALFALGAYFHWSALNQDHSWVGLVCLIVYIIGFAIGLGPVFWLMISEIYPLHLRSKAMAIATAFNWGANFIVSYYFLQMVDAIGRDATFWVYGGLGILAFAYFWVKVPETKNRSLEEIEREVGGERVVEAAAA